MTDWLNAGKTERQKKKEEHEAKKQDRRARIQLKMEFKRWVRANIEPLSDQIELLLRDMGMHAWGKGLCFNKFEIKRGFHIHRIDWICSFPPEYYWLVRSARHGVYRGYRIALTLNTKGLGEGLQEFYGKTLTESDLCLAAGSSRRITLSDVSQESLRAFLKTLYSTGTNYYHSTNPGE